MSKIIEVTDLSPSRPGSLYAPDAAQLRSRLEPEKGVFIAESPKVIGTALDAGLEPVSAVDGTQARGGPGAGNHCPLRGDSGLPPAAAFWRA